MMGSEQKIAELEKEIEELKNDNDAVLKAVARVFDKRMDQDMDKVVLIKAVTALERVALEAMALWKTAGENGGKE